MYEVKNFLEKNRDTLQPDLLTVILNSGIELIRNLFTGQDPSKRLTVAGNFKVAPPPNFPPSASTVLLLDLD
jgi:myosin heavy subunit